MARPRYFWTLIPLLLLTGGLVSGQTDEGGFRSIAEYRAADPSTVAHIPFQNIDDLFDQKDLIKRFQETPQVRLWRRAAADEGKIWYSDFEKVPLDEALIKSPRAVNLTPAQFKPLLDLASDFNNYSDGTLCEFKPGLAVLIGGEEPEFVLVCCFSCHDVQIIRRPTATQPEVKVANVSMSPELEKTLFELARQSYPEDKELQDFKLAVRQRASTPLKPASADMPVDPFAKEAD